MEKEVSFLVTSIPDVEIKEDIICPIKPYQAAIQSALNTDPKEVDQYLINWHEGPLGGSGF